MAKLGPLLWLLIGGVLAAFAQGRAPLAIAAWLGPLFLLHFMRLSPPLLGLTSLWLTLYAAAGVAHRGVLPLSVLPYCAVMAMGAGLSTLPYLADRLLAPSLPGPVSTLAFPLAWVAVEFLTGGLAVKGTWGCAAYSQYGNLPLMQLAALTGIWGISFLIAWFGAVVACAWDQRFEGAARTGLLLYAAAFSLVMFGGAARLALAP